MTALRRFGSPNEESYGIGPAPIMCRTPEASINATRRIPAFPHNGQYIQVPGGQPLAWCDQKELGSDYEVIDEALNGRTTDASRSGNSPRCLKAVWQKRMNSQSSTRALRALGAQPSLTRARSSRRWRRRASSDGGRGEKTRYGRGCEGQRDHEVG